MSNDQNISEASRMAPPKAEILFIDDSRFLRKFFTVVFSELGYDVETAPNGKEGIRIAGEKHVDVIVVDGILPDMDGREVCRQIQSLPGENPIMILYTASNSHFQDRFAAVSDGVDVCIRKNADSQFLADTVAELLVKRDLGRLKLTA